MIVGPHSILLDAQPLSAIARNSKAIFPWLGVIRRTDSAIYVSVLTLAEATDGTARDVPVRRIIKALRPVDVDVEIAFTAGRLHAAAGSSRRKKRDLTVDAVVAATALVLPTPVIVLTSDPDDLQALLVDTPVQVERIG